LANDSNAALKELHDCLEKDPTMVEAHILAAVINSECGNTKASNVNLQQEVSTELNVKINVAGRSFGLSNMQIQSLI
jgi:Tfp pilus assembly protein PilF